MNSHDKSSRWECHDCGYTWPTSAKSILNDTGCPKCADYGFNTGKPGYVYLHNYTVFNKIGITNCLEQRHNQLDNQTIDGVTYTIKNTQSWYFKNGSDAADLEATILKMFKKHAYTGLLESSFDGRTELFKNAAHQEILDYVNDNYDIVWE